MILSLLSLAFITPQSQLPEVMANYPATITVTDEHHTKLRNAKAYFLSGTEATPLPVRDGVLQTKAIPTVPNSSSGIVLIGAPQYGFKSFAVQQPKENIQSEVLLTKPVSLPIKFAKTNGTFVQPQNIKLMLFGKLDGGIGLGTVLPKKLYEKSLTKLKDGSVELGAFAQGAWLHVEIDDPRFPRSFAIISSLSEGNEVKLSAYKGAEISGKLLDPSGQPVAGQSVSAVITYANHLAHTESAVTKADGTYAIKRLGPGTFNVVVDATKDYLWAPHAEVTLKEGEQIHLEADKADPGVKVQLKVIDKDGNPMACDYLVAFGGTNPESSNYSPLQWQSIPTEGVPARLLTGHYKFVVFKHGQQTNVPVDLQPGATELVIQEK